jgi:hypothetical protein
MGVFMTTLIAQANSGVPQGMQFRGGREENYYFPYWTTAIVLGYIITFLLVKTKKLSLVTQRKFWNLLLLLTFLAMAVFGLLLVFRSQYHLSISLPVDIKFWHVEMGIGFSLIAIFHALWHLAYFKGYFKK